MRYLANDEGVKFGTDLNIGPRTFFHLKNARYGIFHHFPALEEVWVYWSFLLRKFLANFLFFHHEQFSLIALLSRWSLPASIDLTSEITIYFQIHNGITYCCWSIHRRYWNYELPQCSEKTIEISPSDRRISCCHHICIYHTMKSINWWSGGSRSLPAGSGAVMLTRTWPSRSRTSTRTRHSRPRTRTRNRHSSHVWLKIAGVNK